MPAKGRKGNGGKGKGHAPAGKGALAGKGKGGAARKGNASVAGSVPTEKDAEVALCLSSPANPPPAPKHRPATWPDSSSPALRRSGNTFAVEEATNTNAAGMPTSASHLASRVLSFDETAAAVGQTAAAQAPAAQLQLQGEQQQTAGLFSPINHRAASSDGLGFASQVFQYGGATQENVLSAGSTGGFASQVFQYGGATQENVPSAAAASTPVVRINSKSQLNKASDSFPS